MPFDEIFVPDAMGEAVSDQAWLEAMLAAEAALARAQARVGLIPAEAAHEVAEDARLAALRAHEEDGALHFDIHLQGEHETVFLAL